MNKPAISVVIPAYNEERYLPNCLQSLSKQTFKDFEIIVVDNNSSDHTDDIAKQFGANVIKENKQGIAYTRAKGINSASAEIIAITEADTEVPPNWLAVIYQSFSTFPQNVVGLTGPLNSKHKLVPNWFTRLISVFIFDKLAKLLTGHVQFVGMNMALRKSAWKKVRPCGEIRFIFDEIDISYHMAKVGEIKYLPELNSYLSLRKIKENPPRGIYQYLTAYPMMYLKTIFLHHPKLMRNSNHE